MTSSMPWDKINGSKRNILSNAAYSIFTTKKNTTTTTSNKFPINRVNYNNKYNNGDPLQRSVSADNVVIRTRGFKPSDRHDPAKRNFLETLSHKILHVDMESGHSTPINIQKLLTPASESSDEATHVKNSKKMYASSYFYAPTHPTVEDQVELARRISNSLSDVKNVKSKGQSMYVNRKKRSVKWIHDGNGIEDEEEISTSIRKEKIPLKCMMNPGGKVLDIEGIQALGEDVNIPRTPPPDKLFDIVRDLNNQKGRGAEIFAKRRKRSEKWVVDASEPPQTPPCCGYVNNTPTYPLKQEMSTNENTKFENQSFYNPFTVDISMDYSIPASTGKLYDKAYSGPKISSYQNLANYNTAPRGWNQNTSVYKPVKFEKPKENKIVYSDF